MPEGSGSSYSADKVGDKAIVQQGEGNFLVDIDVQVEKAEDAEELLEKLRKELGTRAYRGPLLRRLDPIVLTNRADEIQFAADFLESSPKTALVVLGMAGIGKSTLVRGIIELRRTQTPVTWLDCCDLDADHILAEVDAGFQIGVGALLRDPATSLAQRTSAVLVGIEGPSLIVLDSFEDLLDGKGGYRSEEVGQLIELMLEQEHKANLLITTRRLAKGMGAGNPHIEVLHLRGLAGEGAEELLRVRGSASPEAVDTLLPSDAFARLEGHPKFIELLASAAAEIPAEEIMQGILASSDIGDYVARQVLRNIGEQESALLDSAVVFRGSFPADALKAVYSTVEGVDGFPANALRSLVRRALLEPAEDGNGYFLHPVVRDVVPRTPDKQARAHTAAAEWAQQTPFDPEDFQVWDTALFHLRSGAEIGGDEQRATYGQYLNEVSNRLQFAGWGRRLIREWGTYNELAQNPDETFLSYFQLAGLFWSMGDIEEAKKMYEQLDVEFKEEYPNPTEQDYADFTSVAIFKAKLGDIAIKDGDIELAERYADEMKPFVEADEDPFYAYRLAELRFAIARARQDGKEALRWAEDTLRLAQEELEQDRSEMALDRLAEANFNVFLGHFLQGELKLDYLLEQLRLKIEVNNIPGIAGALTTIGRISARNADMLSFAWCCLRTARQIEREVELAEDELASDVAELEEQLQVDTELKKNCSEALERISPRLVPYFERSFE